MPFDHLPAEIILMIFHTHIYLYLESRRSLLLTCRSWYNILTSCSYMWENVCWLPMEYTFFRVTYQNIQSLDHAADRVGKSFDLALLSPSSDQVAAEQLGPSGIASDEDWLSRCRSLTLWLDRMTKKQLHTSATTLHPLMHQGDFQSLESLTLKGGFPTLAGRILTDVITQIDRTAPNLTRLDVGTEVPLQLISQHSGILGRISSLSLWSWETQQHPVPWSQLINLKYLHLSQNLYDHEIGQQKESNLGLQDLIAPKLATLHLNGDFVPSDFFSNQVLERITHLILENFGGTQEGVFNCALPELTFLGIEQEGTYVMSWIRAERLEELRVNISGDPDVDLCFYDTSITPRVLRVDIPDVERLDDLTTNCFGGINFVGFAEDLPIWSRVEELHLTFFRGTRDLSQVFMCALVGDPELCYPKLHCLTVRYSNASRLNLSQGEKQEKVDELLAIRKQREGAGLPKIRQLEVGWHWVGYSIPGIGNRSPEPWMTEWRNCLEGETL